MPRVCGHKEIQIIGKSKTKMLRTQSRRNNYKRISIVKTLETFKLLRRRRSEILHLLYEFCKKSKSDGCLTISCNVVGKRKRKYN